jgi:hypothetical protein
VDSLVFDNGTNVGIGTQSPTLANLVISPSVGTGTVDGLAVIYNPDGASNRLRAKLWINDFNGQLDLKDSADVQTVKITSNGASYFNGGQLGIGTTNPLTDLHISKAGSRTLRITNSTNSTDVELGISTALGYVGTKTDNSFAFNTNDTERMRLTSTGLGIGTTSPLGQLDVYTGTFNRFYTSYPDAFTSRWNLGVNGFIQQDANIQELRIAQAYTGSFSAMTFYMGASERMRLTASGNLGLAVVPSAWGSNFNGSLQITSGSLWKFQSTAIGISQNAYNDGSNWIYSSSNLASVYSQVVGEHRWSTAPSGTAGNAISFTQAMTLGTNSGLSIGTTTAAAANGLLVAGAATFSSSVGIARSPAARRLEIQQALGGNAASIGLYDGGGSLTSVIGTEPNANDFQIANSAGIRFYTGSSIGNVVTEPTNERLRITSGGNLLVGTTSDNGQKLQVNGDILCSVDLNLSRTGVSPAITLSQPQLRLVDNSTSTTVDLNIYSGGLRFSGSIQTGAPSGGTAKPFKIGAAASVSPTSPNRTIEIEIDGTTYYLSAKTTND